MYNRNFNDAYIGGGYSKVSGVNLIYGIVINSLCNTGVSLFVLISGYFGMKFNIRKIISIELTTVFYALLTLAVKYVCGLPVTVKEVFYSFFPVSSRIYWYITSYMLLMIFSDYINLIPEKLSKKSFQKLILIMLIIFSVLPSIIQVHIMGDAGKGVLNMLLIYLIGRYLKKYDIQIKSSIKLIISIILLLGVEILVNYLCSMLRGGIGIYAPFARDCSIFIVILSVLIFLYFKKIELVSPFINMVAKNIIGIYLFESAVRIVIYIKFDISQYLDKWYLFAEVLGVGLIVFVLCTLIESIRRNTIGHVEDFISSFIEKKIYALKNSKHWL